jgi:hypothetical protein
VNRSSELDEVRRLLFPSLSEDEGWAKVEQAFERAADPRKQEAIEAYVRLESAAPSR